MDGPVVRESWGYPRRIPSNYDPTFREKLIFRWIVGIFAVIGVLVVLGIIGVIVIKAWKWLW